MSRNAKIDWTTMRERSFCEMGAIESPSTTKITLTKSPMEEFQVKFQSLLEKNHKWIHDGPEAKTFKEALALVNDGGRYLCNSKVNAAFKIVRDHVMKQKKLGGYEINPLLLLFCARLYGSIYEYGRA